MIIPTLSEGAGVRALLKPQTKEGKIWYKLSEGQFATYIKILKDSQAISFLDFVPRKQSQVCAKFCYKNVCCNIIYSKDLGKSAVIFMRKLVTKRGSIHLMRMLLKKFGRHTKTFIFDTVSVVVQGQKRVSNMPFMCDRSIYIHIFENTFVSLEGHTGNWRETRCWLTEWEGD